jgi:hypothetical protein
MYRLLGIVAEIEGLLGKTPWFYVRISAIYLWFCV